MPPPRLVKVLFICTGNSCRSQMAEALLRHMGGDRFDVRSAGTNPAGFVHPLAVEAMRRLGVPTKGQTSKSWKQYADEPQDAIITVCDHAACAPAPRWTGTPARAHWSLPDPSFVGGTDDQRIVAAMAVAKQLQRWIDDLLKLPVADLDSAELQRELERIAAM